MSNGHERLDVLDWQSGQPTGETVLRSEAHQKGIPHKAMHLWVYSRIGNQLVLLFQQRSFDKINFPGQFGPTVGGHVASGEGKEALVREASEEVGLEVSLDQIHQLGYNRFQYSLPGGYEDYEWIEDWRTCSKQPLEGYSFNDGEVIGMLAIGLEELIAAKNTPQSAVFYDGQSKRKIQVGYSDFVTGLYESPLFSELTNPTGLSV